MEAKELMIGDKVMVKILSQIPDTYVLHTWTANDYSRDFKVMPIPLTAKILEKNGIKKRRDEYMVFGWDGAKQWYVAMEDFKPQYDFWFITSSDRDLNISGKIRYVHQLQHVLRLCGLNDLADNFKV